ncbi:hypothetical protein EON81_11535 [bacterium]|nr:MAG: hypothetical protein EON81_11535 [bacterium]
MTTLSVLLAATTLATPTPSADFDVHIDETKYTVRHVYSGGYALAPKNYRILVVRYHVRNGASYPLQYNREAVSFSILNGKDRSTAGSAPLRMADHGRDELKPGESRQDETWLEVPYDAESPQLGVRAGSSEKTYPLTSAKADSGPWRDTPATLSVKSGEAVPFGPWDVSVARVSRPATSPTHLVVLDSGEHMVVVDVDFKSAISDKTFVTSQTLVGELLDVAGKPLGNRGFLFDAQTHDRLDRTLGSKGKLTAPLAFDVPDDFKAATLRLTEPASGRAITLAL